MWIKLTHRPEGDHNLEGIVINMDLIVSMNRSEESTILVNLHGFPYEVIDTVDEIIEEMNRAVS